MEIRWARALIAGLLLSAALAGAVETGLGFGRAGRDREGLERPQASLPSLIDRVLERVRAERLRTDRDSPSTILHGVLALGEEVTVLDAGRRGPVDAIDYLLGGGDRGVHQVHPDQILMVLATAGVPAERRPRSVAGESLTPADLLDSARRDFVEHQELGWTLVALSAYGDLDEPWTNAAGATYRIEDLIGLAIARDPRMEACGGTHHLYGVAYALRRHAALGGEIEGIWERARAYLDNFVEQTRAFQLESGELSAAFFRGRAASSSARQRVFVSGHGLEWLTVALPGEELKAPWIRRVAHRLCEDLLGEPLDTFDAEGLYHAAHALRRYRDVLVAGSS